MFAITHTYAHIHFAEQRLFIRERHALDWKWEKLCVSSCLCLRLPINYNYQGTKQMWRNSVWKIQHTSLRKSNGRPKYHNSVRLNSSSSGFLYSRILQNIPLGIWLQTVSVCFITHSVVKTKTYWQNHGFILCVSISSIWCSFFFECVVEICQ